MADRDEDYDEELDEEEEVDESTSQQPDGNDGGGVDAAQVEQEPEEELPEEKPFDGHAPLHFGGSTLVEVTYTDKSLPAWLQYIISDDEFWFQRTVAEGENAEGGDDEGGDAEPAQPSSPTFAEGEDDEEGEGGADGGAGGAKAKEAALPVVPFDPNLKLVLEYVGEEGGKTSYAAKVYVPPPPPPEEDEEGGASAETPAPDNGTPADDEGEEGDESRNNTNAEGAGDAQEASGEEEENDAAEIFIDVLTLCAYYSPMALKYALTWKPKEDSGVAPLSTAQLEDWTLHTVGSDAVVEGQRIRENLVTAARMWQEELAAAHDKAFRARAVAADAEALAEEAQDLPEPTDEEGEDGAAAAAPKQREPLRAEDVVVPPCPQNKIPLDFNWIFEKLSANPKTLGRFLQDTLIQLLNAGFTPSKLIAPEHIRSSKAVQTYGLLLMRMPRSALIKWTLPKPDGEDDLGAGDEGEEGGEAKPPLPYGIGTIMAHIRTMNARAKNGKGNLRKSGHELLGPLLPTKFDVKNDPVIAAEYATRGYAPNALELRTSDLLLMVLTLAQPDFTLETFKALLKAKLELPQELSSNTGLLHLLFHTLGIMAPAFGEVLLETAPFSTLGACGLVDPVEWCKDAAATLPAELNQLFAKKFWDVLITQEDTALAALKESNPALASAVEEMRQYSEHILVSIQDNTATSESLTKALSVLGSRTLCTPHTMFLAVEANNQVAAEWLFALQGVTTVQKYPDAAPISALQHSLESRNVAITSLLVHHGADLRTPWDNGRTNGLIYINDHWAVHDLPETPAAAATADGAAVIVDAFSSAERKQKEEQHQIVQDLLTLWKTREFERATDPQKKFGLLLTAA